MNDLLGRVGDRHPSPKLALGWRGACEPAKGGAEESLAAARTGRGSIAVEEDVARDATDECPVPMKGNCAAGVQIVPGQRLDPQLVDRAELPFERLPEPSTKLRQRAPGKRREAAQDDDAMFVNQCFQERNRERFYVGGLPTRFDHDAEGLEVLKRLAR